MSKIVLGDRRVWIGTDHSFYIAPEDSSGGVRWGVVEARSTWRTCLINFWTARNIWASVADGGHQNNFSRLHGTSGHQEPTERPCTCQGHPAHHWVLSGHPLFGKCLGVGEVVVEPLLHVVRLVDDLANGQELEPHLISRGNLVQEVLLPEQHAEQSFHR